MRPVQSSTLTAVGTSAPVVMDTRGMVGPIGVELIISGTNTAKVQYTLDDVFSTTYNAASGNWFDSTITGSTSQAGSITVPATALRVNCTAYTSGSCYLRAVQGSVFGG